MRKAGVESQEENCDNYHSVLFLSEGTNQRKRFVRAFMSESSVRLLSAVRS